MSKRKAPTIPGEEMQWALKRIGKSYADALAWVVVFCDRDLDKLRPEEMQAVGRDLRSLGWLVVQYRKQQPNAPYHLRAWESRGRSGTFSEDTVRAIQARVSEGIRNLFKGVGWEMPAQRAVIFKIRDKPKTGFGVFWQTRIENDATQEVDSLIAVVGALVLSGGERLRACLQCGKVFVSNKRQQYCSPAHSQEMRNQRKKEAGEKEG